MKSVRMALWVAALLALGAPVAGSQDVSGAWALTGTTTQVSGPDAGLIPASWTADLTFTQPTGSNTFTLAGTMVGQAVTGTGLVQNGQTQFDIEGLRSRR